MKQLTAFLCLSMFLLSSCASGRVNWRERGYGSERASRPSTTSDVLVTRSTLLEQDTVRSQKSSYRIRGTDQVGALSARQHAALRQKTQGWGWPLRQVSLTSQFGYRSGEFHDGVDLRADSGTPVYAVAPGVVIYSGSKISGYGRMVVIRHAGKLSTVYAHNSRLAVHAGQKVRRGQLLAYSGNTGRSTGPHVHFEVREGVTAINPVILMPSSNIQRRVASGRDRVRLSHAAARLATNDDGFRAKRNRR